ncbi:hypothetical protein BJ508DRAFT_410224 [Ascobolus immersus RN42]|uniref:Myb-like transcription factor n=1 Tax=Ascobolus immersus RN42 TaxID=1160509 RepID=A0A3N4IRU4_ASCIM|nr:hypothetical protein BJ508DRAFT_410224 [Ascobolus immersus RN42]
MSEHLGSSGNDLSNQALLLEDEVARQEMSNFISGADPTPPTPSTPQMTGKKRSRAQKSNKLTTEVPSTASGSVQPIVKKSRTNTPWTPEEEQRLKRMRDSGNSWSEIAKTFPNRTEGSVKKHWYKDMHYAEFGQEESAALLAAIKEYDSNKWKSIGQKVGKPAKACEAYAKEHFGGRV